MSGDMGLLVAHTGGFGWDEALIFAIPVAILGVLQLLARRKARVDGEDGDEGGGAG
jgi:hypothetical protein